LNRGSGSSRPGGGPISLWPGQRGPNSRRRGFLRQSVRAAAPGTWQRHAPVRGPGALIVEGPRNTRLGINPRPAPSKTDTFEPSTRGGLRPFEGDTPWLPTHRKGGTARAGPPSRHLQTRPCPSNKLPSGRRFRALSQNENESSVAGLAFVPGRLTRSLATADLTAAAPNRINLVSVGL
jgi:hypothetical protein